MTRARRGLLVAALGAATLAWGGPAGAQGVVVKMATLVPDGSAWHGILKEMGEEWKRVSNGTVTLRIYAGSVAGDDADVVRKMRLGTLGAGLLSSTGLADIDRSLLALQVPMAYTDYAEFDAVLAKASPSIAAAFAEKRFVLLDWADGGWVKFFTRAAVTVPDDLKKQKLFAWAGDTSTVEIWKAAGFHPVPLPSTEISTALQTGLINALPTTPQAALLLGWFNQAKYMTDVNWAVLLGGLVVAQPVWERIPEALHEPLAAAARTACARLRDETRRRAAVDVEAMRSRGLTVVALDAAAVDAWRKAAEAAYPRVRGEFVPTAAFDQAMAFRDEYRRAATAR